MYRKENMYKNEKHPLIISLIIMFVILFILIIIFGYRLHWAWTGFDGATVECPQKVQTT
jgi:hypothetical protein